MKIEKINPIEFGLKEIEVQAIESAFLPKITERNALAKIYEQLISEEITHDLSKRAKETRLKLVKVRTGIADIHKTQKAFFLAAGRFVDAWKNQETLPVTQMEERLDEIENYFINIEKERIENQDKIRKAEVAAYTEFPAQNLGAMDEPVYSAYLTGLKVAYAAKIEAEAKAEAERLAAIEAARLEQIRIREENERLRREAVERENQMQAEREAAEAALRAEREAAEAALRAEREAAAKAAQEAAKIQREAAEKQAAIDAEIKAKADAERKADQERLKAKEEELKAPLKNRLKTWVDAMEITAPEGMESNEKTIEIMEKFNSFKVWAKSEISKM